MKKIISLLLSAVMLISTLCAVDLSALALNLPEVTELTPGQKYAVEIKDPEEDVSAFTFEVVLGTEAPEDYLPAAESISFTPANEIVFYEGVSDYTSEDEDGNLVDVYDLYSQLFCSGNVLEVTYVNGVTVTYISELCTEIDEDGNLFNRYFICESVGDTLNVNYTDGTSKTFTCVETDGDENFEEPHLHFVCGDEIIDDYIVGTDELESEPGTYTTQFEYFARTCDFTYTIEETDIESITVKPVKTELVKGVDSELYFGEHYYICPDFTAVVEYKDGSVKEYPISLSDDEEYPVSISIYDDQFVYDNELDELIIWQPGEAHEFIVYCTPEIFDTIEVEIVDCAHKNQEVVSYDATCTEDGCIDAVICLDCGEILDEGEIIEAPGHTYDEDNAIFSPATTEADGYFYNECTVCGEPDGMFIPMVEEINISRTTISYTGTVQRPSVTVVDSEGEELVYKQDFTVDYSNWNSKDAGEYTVTVNLIGNYDGTFEYDYTIVPQTKVTPKLNRNVITTNGTVQRPSVTVTDSKGKQLVYKQDFTVNYSNWNSKDVGRYTVTVTMQGNYSGTYTYAYYINPKPTTLSSVTARSKGFTVKWNKQTSQTTGYQIQYATKKDFSNAATVYGGPSTATSKTLTGRAGNARYYVRIRTYKNIGGKYFYSSWSSAKSVVTSK